MNFLLSITFVFLHSDSFDSSLKDYFMQIKNQETQTLQIHELDPKEFKSKLEKTTNAVLIDVRTPEEFSEGHIENAINIDFKSADFEKKIQNLDKTKSYFLYCRVGNRTKGAYNSMRKAGFKTIYVLKGGIIAWKENNFPVVK